MRKKRTIRATPKDNQLPNGNNLLRIQSDLLLQQSEGDNDARVMESEERLSANVEAVGISAKMKQKCVPNEESTSYPDNFVCLDCGLICENKDEFHRHIRIHDGYKKYRCNSCGKRFNRLGHLHSHQNINKMARAYVCSHCEQRFSQLSSLARHERIHTGEKPFGCSQCEMRFNNNFSLKRHVKSHTGEKPFSCSVCFQPFSRQDNLVTHIKQHHSGEGDRPHVIETMEDPYRLFLDESVTR